ncbi:DUF305 domain-containing protein [Pseudonocardia sp. N23]|uniref:DUF305 domain-containing protein n=1 Tax=Pseudonocardia sp. N23 TaxID=1987376 RepID=UPI000BFCCD35|nr:DUF305 domain-containing protein [Pseudonocardia sp. N23]GAY10973.1 putative lipoprotein [Pseudonocardia sp. N23]
MNRTSVLGLLGAAALTAVLVAGCTGSSGGAAAASTTPGAVPTAPATSAAHNAADTAFVHDMIPHHAQAIQMADMAAQRASNSQVKQLAARIQAAQGPEIEQMRGFLATWGEPETGPVTTSGSMGGMDHGTTGQTTSTMPMPQGISGMMTDQQMQQFGQAAGTDFDRMFLQMMTEHHNGAISMAQTEVVEGQSPDAKALAQKIIKAQQSEITEMHYLLSTL